MLTAANVSDGCATVRDVVVEDSTFSRTLGTDPQAGIDIEPSLDYFDETNITIRRCR
jgi:hypothetical protein